MLSQLNFYKTFIRHLQEEEANHRSSKSQILQNKHALEHDNLHSTLIFYFPNTHLFPHVPIVLPTLNFMSLFSQLYAMNYIISSFLQYLMSKRYLMYSEIQEQRKHYPVVIINRLMYHSFSKFLLIVKNHVGLFRD